LKKSKPAHLGVELPSDIMFFIMTRKIPIVEGEYYHIYNRGVDKRKIFLDANDVERFVKSIKEFNVIDPIGSLYELSYKEDKHKHKNKRLVDFVAYSLLLNHYHFILRPLKKNGCQKFMQRLGTGYTNYFNEKYKRSGSLFQGRYKSAHIKSDSKLKELSAYVNLNYKIHQLGSSTPKSSSWEEYMKIGNIRKEDEICINKDIILNHFGSVAEYKRFSDGVIEEILEIRNKKEELDNEFIEL